jgi:hypothetical protein
MLYVLVFMPVIVLHVDQSLHEETQSTGHWTDSV